MKVSTRSVETEGHKVGRERERASDSSAPRAVTQGRRRRVLARVKFKCKCKLIRAFFCSPRLELLMVFVVS